MTTTETAESLKLTSFVTKMIGHQRTMAAGLAEVAKGMEMVAAGYEALQLDVAQIRAEGYEAGRDAARAEVERMRPIVLAAIAWRETEALPAHALDDQERALVAAVDEAGEVAW